MPGLNTSVVLPEPTADQLKALKAIYGSDRIVFVAAIGALYRDVMNLKISKELHLPDTNAATLAFIAARGALFQVGDIIETFFQEYGGEEMRHADAIRCLKMIQALAKEAAID